MKTHDQEQQLIHDIRQTLDDAPLDAATTRRLNAMRRKALEQAAKPAWFRHALPAAAFASISALAIAIVLMQSPPQTELAVDSIDAFEIISSNDELEMYQHLEFYLWLAEQSEPGLG
jgi:anti-sigma factor RsiW